jgi:hypothetical protein
MYNNNLFGGGGPFGPGMMGRSGWGFLPIIGGGFFVFLLWSIFWKGLALWHSAQRKQPWWFIILLVVNTVGILEIIYLFAIAKLKFSELFTVPPKNTSSDAGNKSS